MIVRKLGQAGGGRFPAAGYNENKVQEGVADLLLAKNVDEEFLIPGPMGIQRRRTDNSMSLSQ